MWEAEAAAKAAPGDDEEDEEDEEEVEILDIPQTKEVDTDIAGFDNFMQMEVLDDVGEGDTAIGGGDLHFAPCLRRSLVKMLMADRSISLNDCMDRTCACSFSPSLSFADRRVLNQTALSSGGRELLRDQIRAMYPYLR